jgi:predicted transcriptional regulator
MSDGAKQLCLLQIQRSQTLIAAETLGKQLACIAIQATIRSMETAKEQVQQLLSALPEDVTLEDIQYHLYVRQKIEQGLADIEAGRVVSHAEVQQRLAKWLTK